jgi:hypothetical protein
MFYICSHPAVLKEKAERPAPSNPFGLPPLANDRPGAARGGLPFIPWLASSRDPSLGVADHDLLALPVFRRGTRHGAAAEAPGGRGPSRSGATH